MTDLPRVVEAGAPALGLVAGAASGFRRGASETASAIIAIVALAVALTAISLGRGVDHRWALPHSGLTLALAYDFPLPDGAGETPDTPKAEQVLARQLGTEWTSAFVPLLPGEVAVEGNAPRTLEARYASALADRLITTALFVLAFSLSLSVFTRIQRRRARRTRAGGTRATFPLRILGALAGVVDAGARTAVALTALSALAAFPHLTWIGAFMTGSWTARLVLGPLREVARLVLRFS